MSTESLRLTVEWRTRDVAATCDHLCLPQSAQHLWRRQKESQLIAYRGYIGSRSFQFGVVIKKTKQNKIYYLGNGPLTPLVANPRAMLEIRDKMMFSLSNLCPMTVISSLLRDTKLFKFEFAAAVLYPAWTIWQWFWKLNCIWALVAITHDVNNSVLM